MPRALAFIDANVYLTLYKAIKGRALLEPLRELASGIIVTQQVVDEVERNKLKVAAVFFQEQLNKFVPLGLSDHFFDGESDAAELRSSLKKSSELCKRLRALFADTIQRISRSEDDVSIKLQPLFERAEAASPQQIERARGRKERGNPPGCPNDPLGDGLHWEQILDASKGIERFWLISEDGDFSIGYDGKQHLKPLLYRELSKAAGGRVEVHCTNKLLKGLKEFAEFTGKATDAIPRGAPAAEIDLEMSKSLEDVRAAIEAYGHPYARALENMAPIVSGMATSAILARRDAERVTASLLAEFAKYRAVQKSADRQQ